MNNQKTLWDNVHSGSAIHKHSQTPTDFALTALSHIKPHSKILELGCGVGNDSTAFAHAAHQVLATDFSEVAIQHNKKLFRSVPHLKFEVLDLNHSFKFGPDSYDVVYARLSLHYFKDRATKRIFEDIYTILKPRGLLFFMCKSTQDPLYGKGEKIENDMFENEGHVRHFFSEGYMRECLADKFTIIELEEKTDLLYGKTSSFIECIAQKISGDPVGL